jgi:hypothetical protein
MSLKNDSHDRPVIGKLFAVKKIQGYGLDEMKAVMGTR